MLKIFGHKAPDTDATCAAIIWSWYQNECGNPASPYVLGTPNTEAKFVLARWGFEEPDLLDALQAGDPVVIVDTNNPDELPSGINDTKIIEIIDHHKLVGGLETKEPINITIKPFASTATLMAEMIEAKAREIPENIKGLILSCILSDSLAFRSPTTTQMDQDLAERFAKDLGLDIALYASEMFAAKSEVSSFSDAELLRMDSKAYEVDGTKLRVSVLETTTPSILLDRKEGLKSTMKEVAQEDGVDEVLLFIVDILNEEATLLIPNDRVRNLAKHSFNLEGAGDSIVLPGVMSRKKQIIPALRLS